jgi:hypothetical protein
MKTALLHDVISTVASTKNSTSIHKQRVCVYSPCHFRLLEEMMDDVDDYNLMVRHPVVMRVYNRYYEQRELGEI